MLQRTAHVDECHSIADLRALARRRLPKLVFDYLEGGADDEITSRRNTTAFDEYELIPRYLVDVAKVDTRTRVLGQSVDWPVITSPTGMSRLFHRHGERAAACAASRSGTMYSLSTLATLSIEDIGRCCAGPKLFQVYVLKDRELNKELMERCRAAGFGALALTVDVPVAGNRERDRRSGMMLPPKIDLMRLLDLMAHPHWTLSYLTNPPFQLANIAHRVAAGGENSTLLRYVNEQLSPSVTWDDAAWMIQQWNGPFAIKGLLSADDARRAVAIGASAIMISNHGGRQLDGVPAPIDLLPEFVAAVDGRAEVLLDGGIRRGTHVVKALALGARACMIGRPYLYGLAAGGEAGVRRALHILREEIERCMRLLGACRLTDLDTQLARRRGVPA